MLTTMIRLLAVLLFRTFLWGLITGNFGEYNLIGGLVLSAIIPIGDYKNLKLVAIFPSLIRIVRLPFQLIKETIQLMLIYKPVDKYTETERNLYAQKGSKLAAFVDVLVITATPMSLVTGSKDEKFWETHTLNEGLTK